MNQPGGSITALAISAEQMDYLAANFAILYDQLAYGDRQLKAARAGAAGIEIQHPGFCLLLGNVAVAVNHGAHSGGLRLQIETFKDMEDVNRNAISFGNIGFRNISRSGSPIDVAAHCCNRGNLR